MKKFIMPKSIMRINFFRKNHTFKLLVLAFLLFYAYVFYYSQIDPVNTLRLKFLDSLYQQKSQAKGSPVSLPIVIAAIDDESLHKLSSRWPWRRVLYAEFLRKIRLLGPSVVAFDLSFAVPSDNPEDDMLFAESIHDAGNVVLGSYFGTKGRHLKPLAVLDDEAVGQGFLNFPRDRDNTNRRIYPLIPSEEPMVSFSLEVASHHKDVDAMDLYAAYYAQTKESTRSGATPIYWTSYDYRVDEFMTIPIWKFFEGKVSRRDIEGKIILVGVTGEIFHDIYSTPLGVQPGVILQANQIANYLHGKRMVEVPKQISYTVFLGMILFLSFLSYRIRPLASLGVTVLSAVLGYRLAGALFDRGYMIDVFSLLAVVAAAFLLGSLYRSVLLFIENQGLRYQTARDGLTDLFTYRYLDHRLKSEFDRSKRNGDPLTFVIFDLDRFKSLNDNFGHEKGNEVLIAFAGILKKNSREEDIVARYGGEEFCMLLPGKTHEEALLVADRIRKSLSEMIFLFILKGQQEEKKVHVTVSAGICSSAHHDVFNGKELLRLADQALLRAKELGRNRIQIHGLDL